jgi:hypothetical protein
MVDPKVPRTWLCDHTPISLRLNPAEEEEMGLEHMPIIFSNRNNGDGLGAEKYLERAIMSNSLRARR